MERREEKDSWEEEGGLNGEGQGDQRAIGMRKEETKEVEFCWDTEGF